MNKFAKIFESDLYGQILLELDEYEETPEVRLTIRNPEVGRPLLTFIKLCDTEDNAVMFFDTASLEQLEWLIDFDQE